MMIGVSELTKLNPSDNMANAMEFTNVENFVNDSEVANIGDIQARKFEYRLDEKAAKGKLIKGAKRIPFEIVEKSSSSNLIFNLGSWNTVAQPSLRYWNEGKGSKTCRIGETTVRIADVKTGKDAGGKHIDTQVIFFSNRDKIVLHCYNTTQLILVNGHGYSKFIEVFLKPYFESKIALNTEKIKKFNDTALDTLGAKSILKAYLKHT